MTTVAAPASDRLKVMVCAPGETWGGVDRFVTSFVAGLQRREVEVCAALFHDGLLASMLREAGVDVEVVSESAHGLRQGIRLRDMQRRVVADVVHTHGYRATIAGAVARMAGATAPIVKTEHGRLEGPSRLSHVPGFTKLLGNSMVDCVATRGWVDDVVYVSADTKSALARWMGDGAVIYNGIDPADVRRHAATPRDYAQFVLGIVGRLVPVKGHTDFLRALAALPPRFVGRVLGEGPEENALRRLADSLGLGGRVEFRGFVEPVYPEIAALDALVMPSLHEGLPFTVLEAMALGVTIVASRVGGLPEIIEDGVNGILVPPRDVAGLAAALTRLEQEPERRRRLAEQGKTLVNTTFHVDTMVEAYLRVFRRAVARRAPARGTGEGRGGADTGHTAFERPDQRGRN